MKLISYGKVDKTHLAETQKSNSGNAKCNAQNIRDHYAPWLNNAKLIKSHIWLATANVIQKDPRTDMRHVLIRVEVRPKLRLISSDYIFGGAELRESSS